MDTKKTKLLGISWGIRVWLITTLTSPILMEIQNQVSHLDEKEYHPSMLLEVDPLFWAGEIIFTFIFTFFPCLLFGFLLPHTFHKKFGQGVIAFLFGLAVTLFDISPFIVFAYIQPALDIPRIYDVVVLVLFQTAIWYWVIAKFDKNTKTNLAEH